MATLMLLAALLFAGICMAQGKQTVTFSNLGSKKGKLFIGWYNTSEGFRKPGQAVLERIVETNGGETTVTFEKVPAGTYAIAVFLDLNDNGRIDTNILGIPKERYGFSNNVYPPFRAASFKEASFTVTGEDGMYKISLK